MYARLPSEPGMWLCPVQGKYTLMDLLGRTHGVSSSHFSADQFSVIYCSDSISIFSIEGSDFKGNAQSRDCGSHPILDLQSQSLIFKSSSLFQAHSIPTHSTNPLFLVTSVFSSRMSVSSTKSLRVTLFSNSIVNLRMASLIDITMSSDGGRHHLFRVILKL